MKLNFKIGCDAFKQKEKQPSKIQCAPKWVNLTESIIKTQTQKGWGTAR